MTAFRRGALFLLALALLMFVFAPLRFALDRLDADARGLAAAKVEGTIWSGRMLQASFRGLRLGDVHAGLRPLPLLLGRSHLVLETLDRPGRAVLIGGGGRSGLSDATLTLPFVLASGPVPLSGELRLQDVEIVFRSGDCQTAQGRVVSDILTRNADFLQWQGPELTAQIACRGRSVLIPFRGVRDGTEVNAALIVEADGRYRLDTRVVTADLTLAAALVLAGFDRRAEGLTRVDTGRAG